jgi:hypothetical protein
MTNHTHPADDRELTEAQRRWRQTKAMLSFLGGFLLFLEALEVVTDLPESLEWWRGVIFPAAAVGGILGLFLILRGISQWWRFTSRRD